MSRKARSGSMTSGPVWPSTAAACLADQFDSSSRRLGGASRPAATAARRRCPRPRPAVRRGRADLPGLGQVLEERAAAGHGEGAVRTAPSRHPPRPRTSRPGRAPRSQRRDGQSGAMSRRPRRPSAALHRRSPPPMPLGVPEPPGDRGRGQARRAPVLRQRIEVRVRRGVGTLAAAPPRRRRSRRTARTPSRSTSAVSSSR